MQVASSQAEGKQLTATTASRAKSDAPKAAESTKTDSSAQPASSTKVTLSDSAKQLQAQEGKTADKADSSKSDVAATSTMAKSADAEKKSEKPSPMKSLAYGALGLPSPEEQAKNTNQAYSTGKWIAALGTVGGLLAMIARFI
ncbi:hypothetical protein [Robbsia sp. KACC 23696]|uniref:hypothetical protein n=1 Tax=Robbsia sp. KACC 23696 TaxID=3149231 RepID=UPI00325C0BDB